MINKNSHSYKSMVAQLVLCAVSIVIIFLFTYKSGYFEKSFTNVTSLNENKIENKNSALQKSGKTKKNPNTSVVLSLVGDCTIGTDPRFDESTSLITVVKNKGSDYSYLFKNVSDIFKNDDITVANLEVTFTNSEVRDQKQYTFKAPPEFAESLQKGSIEGVDVDNNHTRDFLEKGYEDTLEALKKYNISYFGNDNKWIKEVKGNKIGFLGYQAWTYDEDNMNKVKSDIKDLKSNGASIVVVSFHWGDEGKYNANSVQKQVAHYAIDNGADLVVGHHPHVVQGIERYKGKAIVYSLGNFCFGGNVNPRDKDTFIFQEKFDFKNNKFSESSIRVIPCSVSSVNYINDYCPTPLKDENKDRVLKKINDLSPDLGIKVSDEFEKQ